MVRTSRYLKWPRRLGLPENQVAEIEAWHTVLVEERRAWRIFLASFILMLGSLQVAFFGILVWTGSTPWAAVAMFAVGFPLAYVSGQLLKKSLRLLLAREERKKSMDAQLLRIYESGLKIYGR